MPACAVVDHSLQGRTSDKSFHFRYGAKGESKFSALTAARGNFCGRVDHRNAFCGDCCANARRVADASSAEPIRNARCLIWSLHGDWTGRGLSARRPPGPISALPPNSGHLLTASACRYHATFGPMHQGELHRYSITSSARASSVGGTSRPMALAVLRLMTSSNLIGCSTGRSYGFAPLRILST